MEFMGDRRQILRESAMLLPELPGVYIMKNSELSIIYIGKAKNLKRRVSQYFGSEKSHCERIKNMVSQVKNFDYIITDSEFEALILECSLIKRYSPKYNILLKDDKGYHYIKITREEWPRIRTENSKLEDGSEYLGPYISSWAVKKSVDEAVKIFKIPTCNRNLSAKKTKPCLNYYIGQCMAPCDRKVTHEKYILVLNEAVSFLKFGKGRTLEDLKKKMYEASNKMNFEMAAEIRDKIKYIEKISSHQKVISDKKGDQDVIALVHNKTKICVEVFKLDNGSLYETVSFFLDYPDDLELVRAEFIERYYNMRDDLPTRITLDGPAENQELLSEWLSGRLGKKVEISVPQKGERLKLVEMCKNNAFDALMKYSDNYINNDISLEELCSVLSLKKVPEYIEAYDISNINGDENVGGMVVFKNAQPFKSAYKKFKIKNIVGQDDYGSMREVIERRIKRYKESSKGFQRLPDLIFVDGGIGHTRVIKEVLQTYGIFVPVFGMVKDKKHRTKALTSEISEIEIKSKKNVFGLITRIQDEVHRFTIGYHRKRKIKRGLESELIKINGIGKKRARELVKRFGGIERISHAPIEELLLVPGITKPAAESIIQFFVDNK